MRCGCGGSGGGGATQGAWELALQEEQRGSVRKVHKWRSVLSVGRLQLVTRLRLWFSSGDWAGGLWLWRARGEGNG